MGRLNELLDEFFYRPEEDAEIAFDLELAPEVTPAAVEEDPPKEYLAFALDSETYALPVDALREIVKVPPLAEVPRSAKNLLGVMNLRGEVLPVYDIKPRLHLPPSPKIAAPDGSPSALPRSARVLVLRGEDADAGILVDSVAGVARFRASTLEAPPPGVSTGERDCIVGLGRRGDLLYILLDVDKALA